MTRLIWAVVVDCGGGTTSLSVFAGGHIQHTDAIRVGGHNIHRDVSTGLSTPMVAAERLKTFYGSTIADRFRRARHDRGPAGRGMRARGRTMWPRSQLVRIIRPRVEEILELTRDRLLQAGFGPEIGRRVILTGAQAS